MKTEIVHNMSMRDYRAAEAIAASDLSAMRRSPAYALLRQGIESVPTPAMKWGTAVHTAVLEPEHFDARYAEDPQCPERGGYPSGWRNTKAYKSAKGEIMGSGKDILTPGQMHDCKVIAENVRCHRIGRLIESVKTGAECSVFAKDEQHNLYRKIRPDLLCEAAHTVVDLKTSADVVPEAFRRSVLKFGYHRSAAYYLDTLAIAGLSYDHYVFLVVASDAPFEVRAYTLDEDSIEQGRHEYRELLEQYAQCSALDSWPLGPEEIEELRIPEYAINYHEQEAA